MIEWGHDASRARRARYEWTVAQTAAVRDGRWTDIDVENLSEEIESLGVSVRSELRSRLIVIIVHLLKQYVQPERATRSWTNTIREQTRQIKFVLAQSPSLRRRMPEFAAASYDHAREQAADEMGLPVDAVPERLPAELQRELAELLPASKPL